MPKKHHVFCVLSTFGGEWVGEANVDKSSFFSPFPTQSFRKLIKDWNLDCDELCSEDMFGDCDYQSKHWYTVCGKFSKDILCLN